ncbi:hypothetical protein BSG1_14028 [Bacillus sp. SG-1]|nr:hypothetical protein BSG1_14028 [Bacillus sp. SG-1]
MISDNITSFDFLGKGQKNACTAMKANTFISFIHYLAISLNFRKLKK